MKLPIQMGHTASCQIQLCKKIKSNKPGFLFQCDLIGGIPCLFKAMNDSACDGQMARCMLVSLHICVCVTLSLMIGMSVCMEEVHYPFDEKCGM